MNVIAFCRITSFIYEAVILYNIYVYITNAL